MKPELREHRLEIDEEIINAIRHSSERFNQRLTLNNSRLAERYLKGELHLLIHFRVGSVLKEFVACFQGEKSVGGFEKDVGENRNLPPCEFWNRGEHLSHKSTQVWADVDATECGTHSDQSAMFIDIVKTVQTPERIIPTLIWFDSVNRFYSRLRHSPYFSGRFGFVFRGIVADREIGLLGRSRAASNNELVSHVVKGAPKTVEHIADDDGDMDGSLLNAVNVVDQLSSLRIALGVDCIGIGHKERPDFCLNITEVLFGPFDLRPD